MTVFSQITLHSYLLSIMDVWMEVHFTPPGMENADISDVSTEIFAVGSQFPQCIRRCVIQGIIQKLLVAVDDRI